LLDFSLFILMFIMSSPEFRSSSPVDFLRGKLSVGILALFASVGCDERSPVVDELSDAVVAQAIDAMIPSGAGGNIALPDNEVDAEVEADAEADAGVDAEADAGVDAEVDAEVVVDVDLSSYELLRAVRACEVGYSSDDGDCKMEVISGDLCLDNYDSLECADALYQCEVFALANFDECVADLPFTCEVQPFSSNADADFDGISDWAELWYTSTDPCEPCSYPEQVCDAELDADFDGIANSQDSFPVCNPRKPLITEECG